MNQWGNQHLQNRGPNALIIVVSPKVVLHHRANSDKLESFPAKPESTSDLNIRKIRGRATDHSQIDSDKEAPTLPSRRKDHNKEANTA